MLRSKNRSPNVAIAEEFVFKRINLLCRIGLAFVFFYHGLFPKILFLSAIEIQLMALHGIDVSKFPVSQLAGVLEILLAVFILFFRNSLIPVYLAGVALILLLIDVAIVLPSLLVEAFNPVTTNVLGLFLCYLIYYTHTHKIKATN